MFKRVGIIMGGYDEDRNHSLLSGRSVADGLRSSGIDVVEIIADVNRIGDQIRSANVDAVAVIAWGKYWEDGLIQSYLAKCKIPYTGSRPAGMMLGRDKLLLKQILKDAGIPHPEYTSFTRVDDHAQACKRIRDFGLPVVLKPSQGGSTIGAFVVKGNSTLHSAVIKSREFDRTTVVDRFIEGDDVSVSIIQYKGHVRVLPPLLISVKGNADLFTESAKFDSSLRSYVHPAPYTESLSNRIREIALNVFNSCGVSGIARVDFRVRDKVPYVLEINTSPGMSPLSQLPYSAKCCGLSYEELCRAYINTAK